MTRRGGVAGQACALLAIASLAGALPACTPRTPSQQAESKPRYVVGPAYQAGGVWFYPREQLDYDATGLAAVAADRTGPTANGERFDQGVAAAAHQTLQLPAVLRVTNLENGREVLLRLNDRGPATPKRLLEVTRRGAELLGMAPGSATRVRVRVESGASQAAAGGAGGGATVQVATAPRGAVQAEVLAPPPGVAQSARVRVAAASGGGLPRPAASFPEESSNRLPESVTSVPANPGQLWIRAGEFGHRAYADQLRARLGSVGAEVEAERQGRQERYRVKAGPFATAGQADSALDQALRAGVTDARIVVE